MIPYIRVYDLHLGPLTLHPFGVLVVIGTLVGIELAKRRARSAELPAAQLASFISWMLTGGFIGGHVLDEIFYHPSEILAQPWSLLYLWNGLSSFGGFAGALFGIALWKFYETRPAFHLGRWIEAVRPVRRLQPAKVLPYCDVILSVFPVAWFFGRLGCSVAHDHPGVVARPGMPLSVAYGPGPVATYAFFELRFGSVPRYDLGLLEMLFALVVSAGFVLTWKRRLPLGWYSAVLAIVYAPVRFGLDFLRLNDPDGGDLRYVGLTPAQWACVVLLGAGVFLSVRVIRVSSSRVTQTTVHRVI